MASATAPPAPVSTSSKMSVDAEPRSASTTLSANRKRASSPPEATFISGPGRVPGLVCTQNSIRSMPCGPPSSGWVAISVKNFARSSLSGLSSSLTARSRLAAAVLGLRAGHRLTGIAQVAGNLLRLHHDGALVGKDGFLRRLGSKPLELLDRVAEKICLALRSLDLGAMGRHRARPRTPLVPKPLDLRGLAVEGSKGVEQAAVRRGIHQRALVMLAVDLDQRH